VKHERWQAGFIREEDPDAVRGWAVGVCQGLTLQEAAALFDTEPTLAAISREVAKGLPADTQKIAQDACEAELRAAMKGR
jgi:hypothetical protein